MLPSLKQNSMARLVADLLGVAFALVAATVAARLLGPAGKGYYSSLLLLAGLMIQIFGAGLGEAAIVLAGRGKASLATAVSGTMFALVPLSVGAGLVFWVVATAALESADPERGTAVVLGSLLVVLNTCYTTIVAFLVARERMVAVAALSVLATGAGTVALWFLLAVRGDGMGAAILASVLGAVLGLGGTVVVLHRAGIGLRPRFTRSYLPEAFRLGVALQVSNLLVLLTARLDLLLVYRLGDAAEAGGYSVALTIGALVGSAPIAVSYASFPRLAVLGEEEAAALTRQVVRVGMASAVFVGALLAAASPVVIPLAFGSEYSPAIVPTLILVPAGILWSGQWLLCRAAAARGVPRPLLVSFATSFLAMLVLDLLLIGPLGAEGAALAAAVSPALGLAIALAFYRRDGHDLGGFVPRPSDFVAFLTTVKELVTRGRPAQATR
ncbi:MAG: oligosaccharide flippase family protein [Acidimicrobiales bacterium]